MLKEKWNRPTLAAFIMWGLKKAGLFVQTEDGVGYVISPKFIQCGTITLTINNTAYTTGTVGFPTAFNSIPYMFITPRDLSPVVNATSISKNGGSIKAIFPSLGTANVIFQWLAIDLGFVFGKQMFGGGGYFLANFFVRGLSALIGGGRCD